MKEERRKHLKTLGLWTWSWVATLALATFGPKFIWDGHMAITSFAIITNLANGVLMIMANRKLFNHYDELERKIHLESLAFTLGLTVIVGLSYSLLDQTNLIPFDAEIGILVVFLGVTHMITFLINRKRYL
jgi:DMSO/TMAO reductase YedYZ heme-binding membrane subunit